MNISELEQNKIFFTIAKYLFRAGFASIFLVNSLTAILEPEGFRNLLEANVIGALLPATLIDVSIAIVAVNDLALGIFILSGKKRTIVYAWAGIWLLIVASLKLMNFIW
jgi:hypothetical protein